MWFHNRTSGRPRKIYLAGQNVIMPDPIPDDTYTLYLLYQRLYHLTDDADTFPCPHDFVDCIKSVAKWMACSRKGKSELANHYSETWKNQLHNLRVAELHSEFYTPGEKGYRPRGNV
jgi:hypothetical protein